MVWQFIKGGGGLDIRKPSKSRNCEYISIQNVPLHDFDTLYT